MIEGTEVVDSPENVEAEPGNEDSAVDRGNVSEGVPPSAPAEDEKEGRIGDHSRHSRDRSSKESSAMQVPRGDSSQNRGAGTERRRLATSTTRKARIDAGRKARRGRVPSWRSMAVESRMRRRISVRPTALDWRTKRTAGKAAPIVYVIHMFACCSASFVFLRFPLDFGEAREGQCGGGRRGPAWACTESASGQFGVRPPASKNAITSLRTHVFLPSELDGHIYLVNKYCGARRNYVRVGHMAKTNAVLRFSVFVGSCDTISLA